jgi:hypothetical protein
METFKKRQKAAARREKQQKKAARRMERRNEKGKTAVNSGEDSTAPNSVTQREPTIL